MADAMQEGKISYQLSSEEAPCFTYYKTFGDLHNGKPPIVVLHGGPGSGHEYCLAFRDICSQFGYPMIFYDQIGCASSSHFQQKVGDRSFWTLDLFLGELKNVINHFSLSRKDGTGYHLLGHSWGGILAAHFAAQHPPGLRRMALVGASADGQLFLKGLWDLIVQLPPETQQAIRDAVQNRDFSNPTYKDALTTFHKTFLCRANPWPPEDLAINLKHQAADPTVRQTLICPSPWIYDGVLGTLSSIPILSQIERPTLVINGEFDTTQDGPTAPFFNCIPRVRWITLAQASHMPHLDSIAMRERVVGLIGRFYGQENVIREMERRLDATLKRRLN